MKTNFKKIFIFLMAAFWVILPWAVSAQGLVPCGRGTGRMCTLCDLVPLINNIIKFITEVVVLPLSVIAMIAAGIYILTAAGNESQLQKGKAILTYTIIGLVVSFGSWLIVDTIMRGLASGSFRQWQSFIGC